MTVCVGIHRRFERLSLIGELEAPLRGFDGDGVRMLEDAAQVGMQRHAVRSLVKHGDLAARLEQAPDLPDSIEEWHDVGARAFGVLLLEECRMGFTLALEHVGGQLVAIRLFPEPYRFLGPTLGLSAPQLGQRHGFCDDRWFTPHGATRREF
jgi:hypothetical protein